MDKSELLTRIRNLQREVDSLLDIVITIDDTPQIQTVQVQADNDDWLSVKEVCRRMNISQTTFYEGIKNGLLPPGFAFGPKTKRWRMSDIQAWQTSKHEDECERQNTQKIRGRVSRVRKIKEFCYV